MYIYMCVYIYLYIYIYIYNIYMHRYIQPNRGLIIARFSAIKALAGSGSPFARWASHRLGDRVTGANK